MGKYRRILNAAIKTFADKGFFQSTISQIAKEAGVADGTIYLYFKNKDDILFQFYEYKINKIFKSFRKAVTKKGSAKEKLKYLVKTHLEEFQKDKNMAIVYQAEIHHTRAFGHDRIRSMSKMYREIISEVIKLGQNEGCIRKDVSIGLVKLLISGTIDEVINSWIHSDINNDLVSIALPLTDLFINGLGNLK